MLSTVRLQNTLDLTETLKWNVVGTEGLWLTTLSTCVVGLNVTRSFCTLSAHITCVWLCSLPVIGALNGQRQPSDRIPVGGGRLLEHLILSSQNSLDCQTNWEHRPRVCVYTFNLVLLCVNRLTVLCERCHLKPACSAGTWNLHTHGHNFSLPSFYTACLLTRTSENIWQIWLCTLNIEADTPMKTYTAIKEKT